MKHFPTLLSHEIRMLLVSPSTYIAATAFLGFMGFIFVGILENYSTAPQDASPVQAAGDLGADSGRLSVQPHASTAAAS